MFLTHVMLSNLIQTFMTNTIGRNTESDSEQEDADASDADDEIPPLTLSSCDVARILERNVEISTQDDNPKKQLKGKNERSRDWESTMRRGVDLWKRPRMKF